jgi:hypothetical protein
MLLWFSGAGSGLELCNLGRSGINELLFGCGLVALFVLSSHASAANGLARDGGLIMVREALNDRIASGSPVTPSGTAWSLDIYASASVLHVSPSRYIGKIQQLLL